MGRELIIIRYISLLPLHHAVLWSYAVLAVISNCYPPVWGRLPTRYSPVRHSVTLSRVRRIVPKCFVRLACVKHAASVHPEPGSNSHVKMFDSLRTLSGIFIPKKQRFVPYICWCIFTVSKAWHLCQFLEWKFIEFSGLFHCLVINVRFVRSSQAT